MVAAGIGLCATAWGSDHPANVHWERFLPALPENAANWARGIAAVEQSGYRETRDAYCREARG